MRHGSVVCTVTVYTPSGVAPCTHSGSHCSPHPRQKKLQTQAATTARTKATLPDLQSTGSSKHRKGVNHLFFGDLHISSQWTPWLWIQFLLLNRYSRMNWDVIYFKSVRFQQSLQVYQVSVLPNFQYLLEKKTGYIFPYSNFCCSPFYWKKLFTF